MRTSAGLEGYKRNLGDELETVKVSAHIRMLTYAHVCSRILGDEYTSAYVSIRMTRYEDTYVEDGENTYLDVSHELRYQDTYIAVLREYYLRC